jgi:PAS domain S-box-containing protein
MNLVIRGAARSGFALALLILILIGVLSFDNTQRLVANEDAIFRAQEIIHQLDQLLIEMIGTESAVRAYLFGGRAFHLDSVDAATRGINETLAALDRLLAGDPSQQQSLGILRRPVAEELANLHRLAQLREAGDQPAARELFLGSHGPRHMDEIRGRLIAMKNDEDRAVRARSAAARTASAWSIAFLVIGGLASFGILLAVYLNLNREIAERRKAVEDLGRSEEKYRRIVETASEGIWMVDSNNLTTFVNAELANMLGYSVDQMTGRSLFDFLPGDQATMQSTGSERRDFRIRRADGGELWVYVRSTTLFENGRYQGMMAMLTDISKRKRAEQEVVELNRDLERRVAERTAELARTAAELEKRNREVERVNRMKTEFLARISHELRTPLNAIVGYSELLAEQPAGPLGPPYPRYVANIQEGGRHLLEMVNDLLDISKIEAGRMELHLETFRPDEVLTEVLSVITPLAQIKNIAIENRVPATISIRADRTRFKQVLYNLLSNGVKFTPENGRVWITDTSQDDTASFSVGDTGIGIPAEELESVFDEFHQVNRSRGTGQEGTGLGLAITRRLVELHGGTIRVESTVGEGSLFTVTLGAHSLERAGSAVQG